MSIFSIIEKNINNCENKLILLHFYNKFLLRNKLDTSTYILENGIISFNIKKNKIKNRLKYIKNKNKKFFKKKKIFNKLKSFGAKNYNVLPKLENTNVSNKKLFNKIQGKVLTLTKLNKKIKKNKIKKKKFKKNRTNVLLENKKTYVGFSFYGKPTMIGHKKYPKFQIFHFLKKKNFFNYLKHRIFLLNFVYKLLENKVKFSGILLNSKRGGCTCIANGLFSIRAFISKQDIINPFQKKLNLLYFTELFKQLNVSDINEIKLLYSLYLYNKKQSNFLSFDNNYKKNIVFPICVLSIKKIRKKKLKKRFKKIFKSKILSSLKKRKLYQRKKYFSNTYNIVFVSSKNLLLKNKLLKTEKLFLKQNKKYRKLLKKIVARTQSIQQKLI